MFEPIQLNHVDRIKTVFSSYPSMSYENCFGNLYIWRKTYDTKVAFIDKYVCIKFTNLEEVLYLVPLGDLEDKAAFEKVLDALCSDSKEDEESLKFIGVTEEYKTAFDRLESYSICYEDCRDRYDYIYSRDGLQTLKGKKYHSKRNHINQYLTQMDIIYEDLKPENICECIEMSNKWYLERESSIDLEQEKVAIFECLTNLETLGISGGLLRNRSGEVIAFTAGEPISDTVFCVHFEKAVNNIPGVYAVINQQFVSRLPLNYIHINREDDAGEEGLRKAKLSYSPELLLVKYNAIFK